jgi:hypothetical protein
MLDLKNLRYLAVFLVAIVLISVSVSYAFFSRANSNDVFGDFFIGVDVAYDSLEANKELIDEVSSYTNLFVIGTTGISHNDTKLEEICDYIFDKGMSFIVYTEKRLQIEWVEYAIDRWGEYFLGFYFWDENAGLQLDLSMILPVMQADNYTDAANKFLEAMKNSFGFMSFSDFDNRPLFTSDYALYYFVYQAGYDVVLTQFGWNYSRQLNVALCRGAATMLNREWGVIVAWTYDQPPYIESGTELYEDLVLAYENGADYIVVFDTNKNYTHGILKEEHFTALKDFKQYSIDNPRDSNYNRDRVAFVLPKDYGFGFRGPDDKIWGLWQADELSFDISKQLGSLLELHDKKLDIIYDNELDLDSTYSKYIFWNNTIYIP